MLSHIDPWTKLTKASPSHNALTLGPPVLSAVPILPSAGWDNYQSANLQALALILQRIPAVLPEVTYHSPCTPQEGLIIG